jgi:hypothetical protein
MRVKLDALRVGVVRRLGAGAGAAGGGGGDEDGVFRIESSTREGAFARPRDRLGFRASSNEADSETHRSSLRTCFASRTRAVHTSAPISPRDDAPGRPSRAEGSAFRSRAR